MCICDVQLLTHQLSCVLRSSIPLLATDSTDDSCAPDVGVRRRRARRPRESGRVARPTCPLPPLPFPPPPPAAPRNACCGPPSYLYVSVASVALDSTQVPVASQCGRAGCCRGLGRHVRRRLSERGCVAACVCGRGCVAECGMVWLCYGLWAGMAVWRRGAVCFLCATRSLSREGFCVWLCHRRTLLLTLSGLELVSPLMLFWSVRRLSRFVFGPAPFRSALQSVVRCFASVGRDGEVQEPYGP